MNQVQKQQLLDAAKVHVTNVRQRIAAERERVSAAAQNIIQKLKTVSPVQQIVQARVAANYNKRSEEMKQVYPSPYFVRCDVRFDGETEVRTMYFGKFGVAEESIYSWTAPAAVVRFETPGPFVYAVPGEGIRTGTLLRKDQFMVVDGEILFMATESIDAPRELVYQHYFSQRKTTFVLQEIVERMERLQDAVIRAPYKGSFLISGPAGSGKTTLALHRLAYLMQSPDTSALFTPESVLVLVQDSSTKRYFSGLLQQLGVGEVTVQTWPEWIIQHLELHDFRFVFRYGQNELQRDQYEHEKHTALKHLSSVPYDNNPFKVLDEVYKNLSTDLQSIFKDQQQDRLLDRFDLTVLAQAFVGKHGSLMGKQVSLQQLKGGRVKRTYEHVPLQYSLIVVDEAENYISEQLSIIKSCVNPATQSLLYVGDIAQQTRLGTITDWQDIGEQFTDDRRAVLHKVYRSTKQVLEYIRGAGFAIEVPEGVTDGNPVSEAMVTTRAEEISCIRNRLAAHEKTVVGIVAKTSDYLHPFEEAFGKESNVQIMTIHEAQGAEFDTLFLVGVSEATFLPETFAGEPEALAAERKRVNRDLLYVALTRAMQELHVLGTVKIKDLIKKLQ